MSGEPQRCSQTPIAEPLDSPGLERRAASQARSVHRRSHCPPEFRSGGSSGAALSSTALDSYKQHSVPNRTSSPERTIPRRPMRIVVELFQVVSSTLELKLVEPKLINHLALLELVT